MTGYDRVQFWNVSTAERSASCPCHRHATEPFRSFLRGIDVAADASTLYRWVCQLTVAPYSYDIVDNRGRRSPPRLTAGADRLAVGQSFLIGRVVEFQPGLHVTAVSSPRAARLFGPIALTYQVSTTGPGTSRLVVCMTVTAVGLLARLRRFLLGYGDLVMMRKQLRTLKSHAEQTTRQRAQRVVPRTSRPLP